MTSRTRSSPSSTVEVAVEATASKRHRAALGGALWCLVFAVYLPSLSSGFIWDDDAYVTENSTLRSFDGLRRIWLDPQATPQYYPLVFTSFWAEYHLWGLHPAGYHLTNAALHATNAVLAWLVLRWLSVPGAWFAAAAFGLHPVHVESVAWVTERKNVLSACFYLLAMWQFVGGLGGTEGGVEPVGRRHPRQSYALGFVFFVAALLSKSVTCSLPAVLLLLRRWKVGCVKVRDAAALAPLFIIGAILACHTAWLERTHVGAAGTAFAWTMAERFLIAGRALWSYAFALFWPVDLSFVYPRWPVHADAWWPWVVVGCALAVPVAIALRHRRMSGPLVAVLYFGGTLLPALGFVNVYPMRYSFVADHYQYLASLGLLALIAAWWMQPQTAVNSNWRALSPSNIPLRFRKGIAVTALAVSAILAWQRQSVFHDSWALWSETLRRNPTSMIANIQMGRLASRRGDLAAAEGYFREGIRCRTDDLETHEFETNLAHALSKQGRLAESAAEFHKALVRKPDYPEAVNGLGNVKARQGDYPAAIDLYRKSLAKQPRNPIIRTNLGNTLATSGMLVDAEREYRLAEELEPTSVLPRLGLAQVLAREGRLAMAESECLEILQLEPRLTLATQLLAHIRRDQQQRTATLHE
jgi:tetratricopeptide (TPR) repeat protein